MKAVNALLHVLMFICPALVFVFLALPQMTIALGQAATSTDGYSLINFEAEGTGFILTICIVVSLGLAGLLVLSSLVGLFKNGRPGVFRGLLMLLLLASTVAIVVIIARDVSGVPLASIGYGAIALPCVSFVSFIAYNFSRAITSKKSKFNRE